MARRAAAVGLGLLLFAAPVACGDDEDGAPPEPPAAAHRQDRGDRGPRVDSRTTEIDGLQAIVAHPHRRGQYPLIVFVHGAGAPPLYYSGMLEDVAAAGYVVVAPALPGSVDDGSIGALLSLPFQPGRVRDVITAVTTGRTQLPSVDATRVAVMGHSLGGMTALALGYNSCCLDGRVGAIVSIAGEPASFPDGHYGSNGTPLLAIHGNRDDTVPYTEGRRSLGLAHPAYLLTVEGGGHGDYLSPEAATYRAVYRSIVAFLDAVFGSSPGSSLALLDAAGRSEGVRLERRS